MQNLIFHYTDPEAALSILADGFIYTYVVKSDVANFKSVPYVYLTTLKPTSKDEDLVKTIYDLSALQLYTKKIEKKHRNKFRKLNYAFGFDREIFKNSVVKHNQDLWKFKEDIDLSKNKFILIVR